jgi:hypothetical protein
MTTTTYIGDSLLHNNHQECGQHDGYDCPPLISRNLNTRHEASAEMKIRIVNTCTTCGERTTNTCKIHVAARFAATITAYFMQNS